MTTSNFKKLAKTIIRTSIGQHYISYIFLLMCSYVLQFHLFALLSALHNFNRYIDFVVDVVLSMVLQNLFWSISWGVIQHYKTSIVVVLNPLFRPRQKKRYIKSVALTVAVLYAMAVVQMLKIDANFICVSLAHVWTCHIVQEIYKHRGAYSLASRAIIFARFRLRPNTQIYAATTVDASVDDMQTTKALSSIDIGATNYFKQPERGLTQSFDLCVPPDSSKCKNRPVPNVKKRINAFLKKKIRNLFQ